MKLSSSGEVAAESWNRCLRLRMGHLRPASSLGVEFGFHAIAYAGLFPEGLQGGLRGARESPSPFPRHIRIFRPLFASKRIQATPHVEQPIDDAHEESPSTGAGSAIVQNVDA